jgi:hypothetical protein
MNTLGFNPVVSEIIKELIKWGVPAIAGSLILIWLTPFIEKIKVRIDRANARAKQFEEIAPAISAYVYEVDMVNQSYIHGWEETKEEAAESDKAYNHAIAMIRKNEYVYLSGAKKFWKNNEYSVFKKLMEAVRRADDAVLAFNEKSGSFKKGKARKNNTSDEVDPKKVDALKAAYEELKQAADEFFLEP